MSKKLKTNVPLLRFPEFQGNWKTARVDHFLVRHVNPVRVEPETIYKQIGIRSHGKGIFYKQPVTGEALGNKRVYWVHPEAFTVNIVFAWEQAIALTSSDEKGYIASHRFLMFLPKEDRADLKFVLLFFLRNRGKYLLELASPGGAGRNKTLGQDNFAELEITFPKKEEQEKIASFLGAVDTRLNQLRRKREHLQTYKRGVMQKLFSQQIRFTQADGSPFPDWEKKKLGSISEKPQYGLGASAIKFDGKHKYIRITDIDENTHCFTPNPLTSPDSGISPDYQLQDNDLVLARTGASVGKSYLYKKEDGEIYFAGYLIRFRITKADAKFVYYLTLTEKYNKWVFINSMRSGQPGINAEEYSNFSFFLPCKKEQKK
ncbi:restriction endonuclease subunit S [Laspinema olomoucense]|uniref:restriction endonuclease subunit S n=1 Tax=Laspinema olomoucense TaxID=3231600 RepID=UPI0021BB46C4|nr:restriction endonuclease subunit S [Laspinema sp. D3d]MCT7975780.1 restriction endonuclease subunit S [Laspinema sp. D3d]